MDSFRFDSVEKTELRTHAKLRNDAALRTNHARRESVFSTKLLLLQYNHERPVIARDEIPSRASNRCTQSRAQHATKERRGLVFVAILR